MSPVTVGALYDSNTISKAATSFDKKKKKKKTRKYQQRHLAEKKLSMTTCQFRILIRLSETKSNTISDGLILLSLMTFFDRARPLATTF